jgi:hypothetical protein
MRTRGHEDHLPPQVGETEMVTETGAGVGAETGSGVTGQEGTMSTGGRVMIGGIVVAVKREGIQTGTEGRVVGA